MQQQLLRQQLTQLRWYEGTQPDKTTIPVVMESAGVPVPLWDAATKSIRNRKWADAIDQWEEMWRSGDRTNPNLYFYGDRSKCKSYASAAVLRKMALRKKVIGWRNWTDLKQAHYDRIRFSNLKGDEYAEAIFDETEERWMLRDVYQVLVIDDVDVMGTQDFILDEMYELIKHRTDHGLRTVMNGREAKGQPTEAAKKFVNYRDETSLVLR
jgi:hypothetical protein